MTSVGGVISILAWTHFFPSCVSVTSFISSSLLSTMIPGISRTNLVLPSTWTAHLRSTISKILRSSTSGHEESKTLAHELSFPFAFSILFQHSSPIAGATGAINFTNVSAHSNRKSALISPSSTSPNELVNLIKSEIIVLRLKVSDKAVVTSSTVCWTFLHNDLSASLIFEIFRISLTSGFVSPLSTIFFFSVAETTTRHTRPNHRSIPTIASSFHSSTSETGPENRICARVQSAPCFATHWAGSTPLYFDFDIFSYDRFGSTPESFITGFFGSIYLLFKLKG